MPFFSIVTPVYRPDPEALRATITCVLGQSLTDWELVLVDDRSDDAGVGDVLGWAATTDDRVHVVERAVNGGIVAASNDGIEAATGTFIVLLDHDDLLAEGALERVHDAIEQNPDADYLYTDEDKVDEDGNHYGVFRKPPWSPERLRGQMYTSHLSVLRTSLVREVGGFRSGFDGSQDHDLVLRVTERARRVVHVPEVLYHWRASAGSTAADLHAKPYADDARRRAVQEHLERLGIAATTEIDPETTTVRIRRSLDAEQLVSVVIPTRGTGKLIWGEQRVLVVEAVRSLIERGGHDNLEIVVVHDTDTPPVVLDRLRTLAGDRLVLLAYDRPFNFSEKCNLGVLAATSDLLLLLNDDTEIVSDNFVPDLVAPLLEDGVGMTGAHLMFADTSYQHVGLVFQGRWPHHLYRAVPRQSTGPFAILRLNREVSGVTGACIGISRDVYNDVGGMTEQLPLNFNDVDFCLKVARCEKRILWISTARAYHFESQTREPTVAAWEQEFLRSRWEIPTTDPYLPDYLGRVDGHDS
ncbi:glycosyltransferase [Nocardioides sp. YIM 152315]|uniref:glycosyltransferase family 2 protein n=1 Tax=Nocardioides sp. YIM 152315 TaxID=3031760 RepID=UPI0023DBD8EB|nr:glycosyltransferase [Nocardioides sp. YIM 152315]MDF1606176.1 glycosyltransferase [Nocardioides sp. YIM 152315]